MGRWREDIENVCKLQGCFSKVDHTKIKNMLYNLYMRARRDQCCNNPWPIVYNAGKHYVSWSLTNFFLWGTIGSWGQMTPGRNWSGGIIWSVYLTPMVSDPLAFLNPTINTTFSCGKYEKLMVVQQLVPGTTTSSFTLNTKHHINKANGFHVKTDNNLAQQTVISTSCAQLWMQESWLGSWASRLGQTQDMAWPPWPCN